MKPLPTATVDQLLHEFDAWIAGLESRSINTARSYRQAVERFLEHLAGGEFSNETVAGYMRSLNDLAPASRAHHISAVRSFLKWARYQGILDERPEHLLRRPRVTVTSYGRYLNLHELQALVDAAADLSPRHHAAVLTLAMTGLRVSELVQAEWRDLFEDPEGRIGLRVLGKGDKERVIRIREDLLEVLSELHGSPDFDATDRAPLLPSSRASAYSARGIHKLIAQVTEAAGIKKPVSPHWLRHTHATLAAAGGAPAVVIQASLGHARLETSQRYIHWARGLEETTVDSLPPLRTPFRRDG
jgi:integrase/recombinase XerD